MLSQQEIVDFIQEDLSLILEPTQETGALYLGNISSVFKSIEKCNIKAVISICEYQEYYDVKLDQHLKINLDDDEKQNIAKSFQKTNNFIQENIIKGKNVLVHCMAGISRSATIVIAYLMWNKKMKYQEALKFVVNKRDIVYPNHGFRQQLQEYEKQLFQ